MPTSTIQESAQSFFGISDCHFCGLGMFDLKHMFPETMRPSNYEAELQSGNDRRKIDAISTINKQFNVDNVEPSTVFSS